MVLSVDGGVAVVAVVIVARSLIDVVGVVVRWWRWYKRVGKSREKRLASESYTEI